MNEDIPFFKKPAVQVSLIILVFLLGYFFSLGWGSPVLSDFLICLVGFMVWLVFFAQFILPVQTLPDRQKIFERLLMYFFGVRGPAKRIENGIVRKREQEELRRGPGVVWLDSASAAVLRNAVKFTRTVGPGVVFTKAGEFLAAAVDLHTQVHSRGPIGKDQPFADKSEGQTDPEYNAVQKRREETKALTRDGIEVVAAINVVFKIDANEGEGGTRFGYREESVFKAVTGQGINLKPPPEAPDNWVRWNELPISLAVDLWREYLSKFTLNQLFELRTVGDVDETSHQTIVRMINERLKSKTVKRLDDYGNLTEAEQTSREHIWLKEHGIKVLNVGVRRLYFAPKIEEQLVNQWKANWLKTAQKERDQVERERGVRIRSGQQTAQRQFGENSSSEVATKNPKKAEDALEMMLHDTLRNAIRNTRLNRRMTLEQRELSDLIQWLRENK